ncbi:MAG TPA: hypothetical protein ENI97_12435 [Gammaproteobacteria bacterium]|nr:hypothetical protein [Gammaproteobacteria bacterium]
MSRMKKSNIGSVCCLAVASMTLPVSLMAGEIGDIQWHGYLTSSLMTSSDGNYTGDVSNDGGAKDTRMGLTVSTQVDESLGFAAQIKAKGTNDFLMELDWAFANYDLSENATLRFGKIKYPIGMYNEYIDVGYTYPWIRPPEGFYNQDAVGPNLTRVSYNGLGANFKTFTGETELGFDLFGGVVDVPDGHVNKLIGAKFSINMEDTFRFELAANTGVMEIEPGSPRFAMMNDERHTTYTAGVVVDLTNFILSSEFGVAEMGIEINGKRPMDTTSGYVMMGYRMGEYMPHITWEQWDVDAGWGQEVIGVGLRKELTTNSALKFEVRQVTPEPVQKPGSGGPMTGGVGLFTDVPTEKDVTLVGVAIEMVF